MGVAVAIEARRPRWSGGYPWYGSGGCRWRVYLRK